MTFTAYIAVSFTTLFHILLVQFFINVCIVVCFVCFCLILQIMYFYCYVYVFFCYVCPVLSILFHCVVLCIVCVSMCTVLLPPGVNPIAVNKCIISYHNLPQKRSCYLLRN